MKNGHLKPGQVYKYLGMDESNGIQHNAMWEALRRENFCRVKMVFRTELYGQNKILAINSLHWRFSLMVFVSFIGDHRPAAV